MHAAGKIFATTCLKANRDTLFPDTWDFPKCDIFINRRGKYKLLGLQGNPPFPVPCLVGHPDLPMRKILKVVGLLTVMIFFQSKKFTACKVKDEKEEIIFK